MTHHGVNVLAVGLPREDRLLLQDVLQELDSHLFEATSPEGALQRLQERPFALVLLGVSGADPGGLQLARLVRSQEPSRATPLLLVTEPGLPSDAVREICRLGAVDLLFRPLLPEALHARLAWLIELHGSRANEQAVRQSEAELRSLFEMSAVGVAQADPSTGRFIRVNRRFSEITGYTEAELLSRSFSELTHPDDRERDLALTAPVLRGEADRWDIEKRYVRADGATVWVSVTGRLVRDGDGRPHRTIACITDITHHRESERALRESAERLRLAQQYGSVGVWSWDVQTGALVLEPEFEQLYGLTPGTLLSYEQWASSLEPEERLRLETVRDAALAAGEPFALEFRILRADGEERWLLSQGRGTYDDAGQLLSVLGVNIDITERKRSEAALRSSEQRFRALVDGSPVAIGMSRAGRNLYLNPAYRRTFGLGAQEEIAGTSILDQIAPEEHERIQQNVRQRYSGQNVPHSYEFVAIRRDGTRFLAHVEVGQMELADGPATLAFLTDVTERRRSEERTRFLLRLDDAVRSLNDPREITQTSAALLAEVLGAARCAYAEVEPDEDTFVLTGDYGRGVESIAGRYRFSDFGQELLSRMRADEPYVVSDIETHQPPILDLAPYRDAQIQALICVPVHKGGRLVGSMAVHQGQARAWRPDEVELVRAVASRSWESIERARVLRELQEADRRKDQFLATLAHELRNPLAPLSNALAVLRLANKDPAKAEELRALMDRQVRQLTRLIDDLLDISRISRGKVELRRERLELAAVVEGALETVRPFVASRRHELTVALPSEPVLLHADPGRLMQVLSNLVHNAAKFTERGGHLQVTARREGPEVRVSVRDDGPGIPGELLSRVFDMFTQVDQTLTRAHGGLGIGLSLVKSLVEMHGGRVEAHSEGPGRGSEFIVRLPVEAVAVPTEDRTEAKGRRPAGLQRSRVLIVDDVKASADTLALTLGALGQEARAVYDGPAALAVALEFRPDIVFSDIAMPGMDGYEVAKQLRTLDSVRPVLVALTGYGQEEDRRRATEAGFDHHLVKPASVEALHQLLMSVPG